MLMFVILASLHHVLMHRIDLSCHVNKHYHLRATEANAVRHGNNPLPFNFDLSDAQGNMRVIEVLLCLTF